MSAVLLFVGLITVSAVTQVSAQNVRPFKLDGRATWDDLNNAFNPMVGAAFQDGNGTASHMGRFAATGSIFALAAPDPMTGNFPVVGTVVLVAANGDGSAGGRIAVPSPTSAVWLLPTLMFAGRGRWEI